MGVHKYSGFTIVEVSLVLAISSLLLLTVATGVTLAVQRQRFSDSVNGTQSFLQQQFNQTQNTLNDRETSVCGDPNNPGDTTIPDPAIRGASGCIIIGKLIEFEENTGDDESRISSFDVIGKNVDPEIAPYKDYSDVEFIRAIFPTAIKQGSRDTSYIVPWGALISGIKDADANGGNNSPANYIALLRSPRSGILRVYKLTKAVPFNNSFVSSADTYRRLSQNVSMKKIKEIQNDSLKMCLSSVDLTNFQAMLEVIPSGSQDGIVTHFDDDAKESFPCT